MQAGKALKTAAAFMLSVAMLATGAACGTSDDSDASASFQELCMGSNSSG